MLEPKAHQARDGADCRNYAATFDTNVLGTLLSMKHELRVDAATGERSIVNVSSAYGASGLPERPFSGQQACD